jgi:uncharacterized repeat protein (TIGR02543 family)
MKNTFTKIRSLLTFVLLALFSLNSWSQTVFYDDFNQDPVNPIVSSGNPVANYSIWTTVDPADENGGTALIDEYAPGDGLIKLLARNNPTEQTGNRTEVSAPLSVFNEPFKPVLSENSDTVVWVFTARQNRNSIGGTNGFNGTQTGMAVVLASDSTTWGSQQGSGAKGYAVTFLKPEGNMYCVSLSRFDGGLSNYTVIIGNKAEDVFSELRTWVTVRVEYVPTTNEWSLFFRDEKSMNTKGDVSDSNDMRLIAKVVDNTFTNLEMTHFGLALNTPAPSAATGANANAFFVDDFKISLTESDNGGDDDNGDYSWPLNVFYDNFNQELVNPIVSSGNPVANYSIWTTIDPADENGGTALIDEYAPGDGMIKLLGNHTGAGQGNRIEVSAPLASYNEAFKPILSSNPDTLVWVFTAKQNRNSGGGTQGFNGSQTGMAVVLASDSTTWGSQQGSGAKGYAVTFLKPEGNMYCVSLSRFDGGLSNYTVIAGNKPEDIFSELRTWVTVRVEYYPATNEWKLFFRDEQSMTKKGDVFSGDGMMLIETVVDDTFTDLEMTHFGYALNTPNAGAAGANGNAFWIDDFVVALGNIVKVEDPRYSLNTTVDGLGGTITKYPDQDDYLAGSQVELTAIPDTGYEFAGWSGDVTSTDNPLTVTMDANKDITASFTAITIPNYTLNIIAVNGNVSLDPDLTEFEENTQVLLTATPDAGYEFAGWSGDATGTDNPLTVTMDANKDITASFTAIAIPNYTLTITAVNGTVTQSIEGTEFAENTEVVLTATPDAGYEFAGWSGDVTSTDNPLTVTMDANKDITASFTAIVIPNYTLTITAANGTVSLDPDLTEFEENTQVVLTATADAGYVFENWSGDATGTDNPLTVTMDATKNITANFILGTSIREMEVEFSVYPNPSRGIFSIQVMQPVSYKVYNLNGVLVKEGNALETFSLDLTGFNNAPYILQVATQDGLSIHRIMKISE